MFVVFSSSYSKLTVHFLPFITGYAVWRTSTPEPTRGDGIIWTYLKDVTRYIPLFAKPGTFILQLDNLLETGLDGQYAGKTLRHSELPFSVD